MLINIWISFLFPIVRLWFEQTYVPQLLLHETVRAKTELEFSCSIPRAQAITPAERGDAFGMCCPQTWHSSVTFSCYPVEGNRGHAHSRVPPDWFGEPAILGLWSPAEMHPGLSSWTPQSSGISATKQWLFMHQLGGFWRSPWRFSKFNWIKPWAAMPWLCSWPHFEEAGLETSCDSLTARQVVGHHIQPFAIKGFDSSLFQLEDPF